ncbi:MAG: DoxX family membrane protein [candidate division NC10 bacterium]|nr:DoxX family membrane protein [candidate division NC10 bacterium]
MSPQWLPMEPMRSPDRWIACLRIVVGVWFLKGVLTKLRWSSIAGFLPLPTVSERWINFLPKKLAEFASENPIGWYKTFLVDLAIPNADVFAFLTAFGETGVGLGLTLGLLTPLSALVGLLIMAHYFLASFWMGFCQQGFHILLIASMVAFFGSRAGRTWGLDGWLARRVPSRFLLKLL